MSPRLLDELLASSWPPAEISRWRGCRFRYTSGVTRRANSALPAASLEPAEVVPFVERAESFYAEREAPTLFQVSDVVDEALSGALTSRGYEPESETIVLSAEVDLLGDAVVGVADDGSDWSLTSDARCGDDWFAAYAAVEAARHSAVDARTVLRQILLAPALPTRFVAATGDSGVSAVGQVVVDGETACGQCLATAPEARRRGAGAAVMGSLVSQAEHLGARRFTVAVRADNQASLGLCRRVGFAESHRYRYFSGGPERG